MNKDRELERGMEIRGRGGCMCVCERGVCVSFIINLL